MKSFRLAVAVGTVAATAVYLATPASAATNALAARADGGTASKD